MQKKLKSLAAGLLALTVSLPAAAHEGTSHAAPQAAHGGQMQAAGTWNLELVLQAGAQAGERSLVVYVTDHDDQPQPTAGLNGSAIVLAGKARQTVALHPDGANRLRGTAAWEGAAAPKLIVSISGGGKTEQARFAP